MGTCVAEHLVNAGLTKGIEIEHHLLETWTEIPVPDINIECIDGIIIHLTLRHILDMAAGIGKGDVAYITTPLKTLLDNSKEVIAKRVESIITKFSYTRPLFFLSFVEPPQTTRGFFQDNRNAGIYRLVRDINDFFSELLQGYQNSYYVETNDILSYYGCGEGSDSYHQHFTHAGNFGSYQSDNFYLAILQRVINSFETINGADPIKIIITDLDNTLWKGVPAEEDKVIPWMHSEGWPIGYVEALLECKRRGIVLAISSKNNESDTINNFCTIWGEKLKLDDFFSIKINWEPKSVNIQKILNEANILPSNALFIDDNPLEIEEVKQAFPEIRTLSLPQQRWRNVLLHSPQTQTLIISNESRNKTELLKAKVERDKMALAMDRNDYLHSLDLRIHVTEIRSPSDPSFSRALELLNKTNQFNTTGKRWTEGELQSVLLHSNSVIYAASAEDRLSYHGIISVAVVEEATISQLVMSCRVFSLGIETAFLHVILQSMSDKNHLKITAIAVNTERNASSRDLYPKHKFILESTDDDGIQKFVCTSVPDIPTWIKVISNQES